MDYRTRERILDCCAWMFWIVCIILISAVITYILTRLFSNGTASAQMLHVPQQHHPYKGKIIVTRFPHMKMLHLCNRSFIGPSGGIVMGCTYGGTAGFGGIPRNVCHIFLSEWAPADAEAHERQHCGGWTHP